MNELARRQSQVARLCYEGYSNKAIARELGITVKTVKTYMGQIGERIEGRGRPQVKAVRWWAERLMEERVQGAHHGNW